MKMIKFKFEVDPRKLDPSKYCDVTLTTKDAGDFQKIRAHKIVLAALSPKLAALFNEATDQCVVPLVVRNISFRTLDLVIRFLYTGKVFLADKSSDVIEDFRDGLDMLKIDINEKNMKKISEELRAVREIESKQEELKAVKAELKTINQEIEVYPSKRGDAKEKRKWKHEDIKENEDMICPDQSSGLLQPDQIKQEPVAVKRRRVSRSPLQDDYDLRKVIKERKEVGDMVRELRDASQDSSTVKSVVSSIPVHVRPHFDFDYREHASTRQSSEFRGGSWIHQPAITYYFTHKRPKPDPNHPSHLQAMLGPLPLDLDYNSLHKAVRYLGSVRKLFLQGAQYMKDRYKYSKKDLSEKWAYVVFQEEHVAQRLLLDGCINIENNFFGVASMGSCR